MQEEATKILSGEDNASGSYLKINRRATILQKSEVRYGSHGWVLQGRRTHIQGNLKRDNHMAYGQHTSPMKPVGKDIKRRVNYGPFTMWYENGRKG